MIAAPMEPDGTGGHLFFANPDAQPAKNAVLVFLPKPLLSYVVLRRHILNGFGLRASSKQKFEHHFPGSYHAF